MYYSKNAGTISIPQNYSGNTFRVIDESDRTYSPPEQIEEQKSEKNEEKSQSISEKSAESTSSIPFLSSFLSGISIEDILLLGLIFVIHQENPNDSTLLILLILLLTK